MIRAKVQRNEQDGNGHIVRVWHPCLIVGLDHANERAVIASEPPNGDKIGGMRLGYAKLYDLRLLRTEIPLL